jgi:riboflavin kinase/FMN adenylyltransferase
VNIGLRPTFEGQASQTIEAHLLDYSHDLYDKLVSLDFTARLRDERKFDSVEALIAQIHSDIESARKLF